MNAAISLRGEGSLLLRTPTSTHKTVTPLLHRRLSSAAPVPSAKSLPFSRPHRADRGLAPVAAVGSTGGTTVKDTSNSKAQTGVKKAPAITNCRVYSTEGTNSALEVVLSFVGDDGYEVGSPVDLSTFVAVPWKVKNEEGKEELLGVIHQGYAEVPKSARKEVIVVHLRSKAKADKEFINKIQIVSESNASELLFDVAPNSWVHKSQGHRTFFADGLAYLPHETPEALQEWRQAELDEMKGSKVERAGRRREWDRIYDYDVYNDLAGFNDAGNLTKRNVLGGSTKYPYPRRLRTGRARIPGPTPDVTYESRITETAEFWVPLDEAFNTTKAVNFKAYALMAAIPTASEVVRRKVFDRDDKLGSFKEVDTMYSKLADPNLTMDSQDLVTALKTPEGAMKPRSLKLFGIDPDEMKLQLPILSAISSSVKSIKTMVGGLDGLLAFPPPLVVQNRKGEWTKDQEWGRQALAGVNPSMITAVTSRAQLGSLITDALLTPSLEGDSVSDLIDSAENEPRLLVIDLTAVFDQYAERIGEKANRYGYYGRAVLFHGKDKQWRPVAIELHGADGEQDVYTPADHPNLWLLAKGVFSSIDSGYHQLITHWLRTHACTEPYIISTHRNLSSLHPVYKLMVPHWAFTLQINSNARSRLISADGIIEQCFTPGEYALEMSAVAYGAVWRFDKEGLPNDLIARGLAKRNDQGKFKLLLDDYPYADDGMLYWNAMEKWVGNYLELYYDNSKDGKKVTDDAELMTWWNEIVTVGHADKKEGWPALSTIEDLTQILCTMIWIVSGHHAAVNFSQYGYAGYILNRPAVCTKKIPQRDTPGYKTLIKSPADGERVFLETLNTTGSVRSILTVELLSTHADTEVYMGDPNHAYILDPKALALYGKFVEDVKGIEATIKQRNKDPNLKMRSLPYNFLSPFSGPGITNRGVPQSVSI